MANVMSAPQAAPPAAAEPAALGDSLLPQVGQPGAWKAWIGRPENRAALVQAGIALLQPLGVGQTVGGQIGSALGSGLEARDRVVQAEQDAAAAASARQLAQQEADARTMSAQAAMTSATAREAGAGGLTFNQLLNQDAKLKKEWMRFVKDKTTDPLTGFPLEGIDINDPATLAAMQSEFQTLYGAVGLEGAAPGATAPSLGEAVTPPSAAAGAAPPQAHVDYLKANPQLAGDFDAKYGQGAAAKYLSAAP